MNFVDSKYIQTLEIKQSKFIAHLVPYFLYKKTLKALKEKHPKARHFVTASRHLNEFNQIVEHSSDDGEPKGTSGKPTLIVLQGADIINAAIITVRYFGGTKLGTGGLVRAYSDATNLVLASAILLEYKEEYVKEISFSYTHLRKIEYECGIFKIDIIEKSFDTLVVFKIKSDEQNLQDFFKKLATFLEQHFPYPT
ncbi:MAG: YigZ family protein [Sulfurimonas sp.]|nr:YigZ family protein [Sulfurimonas sp.]MDQ7061582.1 YigZ family protein [Sulfurimonas sp.]